MSQKDIFIWHDYETWGICPKKDRIAQFAAIITDLELNIIDKPINAYCKIPSDYLPKIEAISVTGLSPQLVNNKGLSEHLFAKDIYNLMISPNSCSIGYNSLRFDDEFTRNLFYRNFMDPYEREWSNGNSRWDLIDLVRSCYAFRPEIMNWHYVDGKVSVKLEDVAKVNNLQHTDAHNAISDVEATIDLARMIKAKNPKIFDYYYDLRLKTNVLNLIDFEENTPLLHVSGMFGADRKFTSFIAPFSYHPINKNAVITIDLTKDVSPILNLSVEEIRERLYSTKEELSNKGLIPIPIKLVHVNKSPMLVNQKALDANLEQRLNINKADALNNLEQLRAVDGLVTKLQEVFDVSYQDDSADSEDADISKADEMLYDGFFSNADRAKIKAITNSTNINQALLDVTFQDARLNEMLFLFKARNYPELLSVGELAAWNDYCGSKFDFVEYLSHIESFLSHSDCVGLSFDAVRDLIELVSGRSDVEL